MAIREEELERARVAAATRRHEDRAAQQEQLTHTGPIPVQQQRVERERRITRRSGRIVGVLALIAILIFLGLLIAALVDDDGNGEDNPPRATPAAPAAEPEPTQAPASGSSASTEPEGSRGSGSRSAPADGRSTAGDVSNGGSSPGGAAVQPRRCTDAAHGETAPSNRSPDGECSGTRAPDHNEGEI